MTHNLCWCSFACSCVTITILYCSALTLSVCLWVGVARVVIVVASFFPGLQLGHEGNRLLAVPIKHACGVGLLFYKDSDVCIIIGMSCDFEEKITDLYRALLSERLYSR